MRSALLPVRTRSRWSLPALLDDLLFARRLSACLVPGVPIEKVRNRCRSQMRKLRRAKTSGWPSSSSSDAGGGLQRSTRRRHQHGLLRHWRAVPPLSMSAGSTLVGIHAGEGHLSAGMRAGGVVGVRAARDGHSFSEGIEASKIPPPIQKAVIWADVNDGARVRPNRQVVGKVVEHHDTRA